MRFLKFIFAVMALLQVTARAAEPEKSVVQIFVASQLPVWDAPWRFESIRRSSGTGFLIKGKRILTNAHVVSWGRQILVKKYQDPRPYPARVVFVGHDCDLAVLEIEDPNFMRGMEALEIGELPKVRSTVVTYGYPAGGEQISYTRGVVSRIEMQTYAHIGNRAFLGVQTDAAINPGNSGGPVIQDDKVAGVAFQGVPGLENTGFFIPPPVINHFLKDIEDGKYDGFPQAGVRLVPLQNPAYRKFLKLPDDDIGARIDFVLDIADTKKVLKENDVLLKAGEFEVASDGTIVYAGNRVQIGLAFQSLQSGESIPLKIWREGKEVDVSLPIRFYEGDRVQGNQHDTLPRYYVYGGLVFTPITLDYLKTFGRNWSDTAGSELLYELYYHKLEKPATARTEPIILASTLPAAANANLRINHKALVSRINGIKIDKLEDVIRAFEQNKEAQHTIEFQPNNAIECLERAEVDKANPQILKTYGITKDRRL